MNSSRIPTQEDHDRLIRRIWRGCIGAAAAVFLTTGGIVLSLFLAGHDSKKIVEVSTSVFQVLMLSYGLGFFVPALLTSLLTMGLGVRMSRKGLDVGQQTADHVGRLQGDLTAALDRQREATELFARKVDELIEKLGKKGVDDLINKI